MTNREQISVPLPAELRDYVKRTAEREDRSVAAEEYEGLAKIATVRKSEELADKVKLSRTTYISK
jgi:hypothetical protein